MQVLKSQKFILGERFDETVINLITREMSKIDYALATGHEIYRAPIEAFFIAIFVYREIGVAGLLGALLLIAFVPLLCELKLSCFEHKLLFFAVYVGKKSSLCRSRAAHHTQKRVNLMSEIIERIVNIKSFCMEQVYAKMVKEARSKEIDMMRSSLYLRTTTTILNLILKLSIFVCIVSALNMDSRFTASSVYVIISYYSMLFTSMLQFWPLLVTHANEAFVAVERIRELLLLNYIIDNTRSSLSSCDKNKICENSEKLLMLENSIKAQRFVNDNCEIEGVTLRNVMSKELKCAHVELTKGKQYGVVAKEKSSAELFELILGEIECDSGKICINGTISYAPLKPWIFAGSIKENIVFTERFDAQRYSQVLQICALANEIETLPANDETFIDAVCINDSIKARISLARCIYRDADIYLIDNCFSTISEAKDIFKGIFRNFLKVKVVTLKAFFELFF